MRLGFGSPSARLLSISYDPDRGGGRPSLHAFAEPVLLRGEGNPARAAMLGILDAEQARPRLGSVAAAALMSEMLLIDVHRAALIGTCGGAAEDRTPPELDELTAAVHALIHQYPERPWTNESLAAAVHVSRATLHRHFTARLGVTPMSYLTRLRLESAALRLRETDDSIARIAMSVGYASSHAFRRMHGVGPRAYRDSGPLVEILPPERGRSVAR